MNRLCYSAFVAFWSSAATIFALGVLAEPAPESEATFTLEMVAEHNAADDCWMAIEGKVYDLTDYIPKHPTPPALIVPYCGTEATRGMRTKGYGNDHSQYAWGALADYLIGELAAGQ